MLLPRLLPPALLLVITRVSSEAGDASRCVHSTKASAKCQKYNLTDLVSQIRSSRADQLQSIADGPFPDPSTTIISSDQANILRNRSRRVFKRQAWGAWDGGRASIGGCGSAQLGQIMEQVVNRLLPVQRLRLGDIAKILQSSVQRATGKPHEVIMGKGDMAISSSQTNDAASCKLRIGEYYTTVWETPVEYDLNDVQQEQIMSNIDFGERLGGSGYQGQWPFPRWSETPIDKLFNLKGLIIQAECFAGDSIVETIEGMKRMSELRTGDEVLSMDGNTISFSPIVMFLHRDEESLAEFNVITTANGDSLKLTNEHFVYVINCDATSKLRLVRAREVTTDHCLIVARTPGREISTSRVTNVTKVYERGIYAPLTMTGDIIVNDVLSSCHSNLAIRSLTDSFFAAYRFFYRFISILLPERGGNLPFGIEYFTSTLDLFVPLKGVLG